jgi:uncharacterized protein (TIGR03067 family)
VRTVRVTTLLVACGWGSALAAPAPKGDKGPEGTWAVVSSEHDPALGQLPKELVWVFADGKVTTSPKNRGGMTFTYAVKIDPTKNPKEIDLIGEAGDRKVILRGIYQVDKERLTICLGVAAGDGKAVESERPKEFKADKNVQLLTLERRGK